jgi:hypothetical protein
MNYRTLIEKAERSLKHIGYGDRLNPVRDWLALMGVIALALVVVFALNLALFFSRVGAEITLSPQKEADAGDTTPVDKLRSHIYQRTVAAEAADVAQPFVDPASPEK